MSNKLSNKQKKTLAIYIGSIIVFSCVIILALINFLRSQALPNGDSASSAAISGDFTKVGSIINSGTNNANSTAIPSPEPEVVTFLDAHNELHALTIDPNVPKHSYDKSLFKKKGQKMTYKDSTYKTSLGIDVSSHQGYINWNKVKKDGYSFAFIRLGFRGYGKEGSMNLDKYYHANISGAKKAGLKVGVYFFSQAISTKEAKEEANFVLKNLKGYSLDLPIVYDPELITSAEARTDDVSGEQFTQNTLTFFEIIEKAGYKGIVYSNLMWESAIFDLAKLTKYPIWYADYMDQPQTPYHFMYWQYTESGKVDGISGNTDINICLEKK